MKQTLLFNFGGIPAAFSAYRTSRAVVLPVPFDKTSTYVKGADKGPRAIINASRNMELYDIETGTEVYLKGIHTAKSVLASRARDMVNKTREKVSRFLGDGKFVVVLGGEHSASVGSIIAHAEHFEDVSILHLDAHSDRRDTYDGERLSHACVMARAQELVNTIVSVGIRSMDSSELERLKKDTVLYASEIGASKDWIKKALKALSKNVYVTIDLDVFDPSIMPSTGTPEPGGMDWYAVVNLMEALFRKRNVVGFDVVELCPSKHTVAPDFLAAKLVYKLLSFKFRGKDR